MKKNILLSVLFLFTILFNACGSGSHSNKTSKQPFSKSEKEFVHQLFLTEYLWYDQVPSDIDYSTVDTPEALVDTLRVTPQDKWSFSLTAQEYDDLVNQKTEGFGFGFSSDYTILYTFIDSPAYGKLKRGDKILEINGHTISQENLTQAKESLGKSTTFTLLRGGDSVEVNIVPRAYTFKVTAAKIISQNHTQKVGYLRYDGFNSSSVPEMEKAFTTFKNANITDLVIDLRYNGGGSVTVASTLLDNITNAYPGKRQGYLDWNENYKNKNENFYFSTEVEPNDLRMKRVFFLVTKNSASASELVISALKPYLGDANVITIGTATHGKNVGMGGRNYGDNYYFLVNFFVKNNANQTISTHGIPATCHAQDDLSHALGDPNEAMLKTALHYIQTHQCL